MDQEVPLPSVERRKTTTRYRLRVPADCLPHFDSDFQTLVLRETDRLKADEEALRWASELHAKFRRIRETGSPHKQTLSEADARWLAKETARRFLESDADSRAVGIGQSDDDVEALEFWLADLQEEASEVCSSGRASARIATMCVDALALHGYELASDSIAFADFAMMLSDALIDASEVIKRRLSGRYVETPQAEPKPAEESAKTDRNGPLLSACFEQWKRKKPRPDKTLSDTEGAIRSFEAQHGTRGVLGYVRRDAIIWRDSLLRDEKRPLHPKTVNKKLSLLRAVVQAAIDDELDGLSDQTPNPFRNTEAVEPKGPKPRTPYSTNDLNALFNSPVYSSGLREEGGKGEAAYWLPLVALFTGARLEEIGQLRVVDVCEERGIPYLFLRPEAGSIKTGKERRVPVHPTLVDLGLLQYVEQVKKDGAERVFPKLSKGSGGKLTDSWSQWYGRYLRGTVKITDPRTTFHSFRHTFKDACREAGISEEVHDAITGHVGGGEGRSYGGDGFPLGPLAEAMKRICYPDVRLPSKWQPRAE